MAQMPLYTSSCYKQVGDCKICHYPMIKYGKDARGKQRYFCKSCKKSSIGFYKYNAYNKGINENIIALTKENVGILGTARLLRISATTVIKRIKKIASQIVPPTIALGKKYEVDEMRTYVQNKDKLVWIVYALEKETKKVVSFRVGPRTNKTLNEVIQTLTSAQATRIYTDKLINYKYLIESEIHNFKNRCTNHIERNNLTLRTHLKRLNRRTISYSKSQAMLSAVLKVYFWA
ncbi:MAG: IS1 family transposase [Leadbetterella sp.]